MIGQDSRYHAEHVHVVVEAGRAEVLGSHGKDEWHRDDRGQARDARHRYRQGGLASRQVGQQVREDAAGRRAEDDQAHRHRRLQLEQLGDAEGEQGGEDDQVPESDGDALRV